MKQCHKAVDNYSGAGYGPNASTSKNKTKSPATIFSQITSIVFDGYQGNVAVQLWDGSQFNHHNNTTCTIIFHEPSIIRELVLYRSPSRLTEAYLNGIISINGDMETFFDL